MESGERLLEDHNITGHFAPFEARMRSIGLDPVVISAFRHYYALLLNGETGLVDDDDIRPVRDLTDSESLFEFGEAGLDALSHVAVIKLNGGLGTGMGLNGAKSLLPARARLTFLDIIVRQVLYLRRKTGCALPLVLMNSFATHEESHRELERYPQIAAGLPLDFMQSRVPRILHDGMGPVDWPEAQHLAWCPPGHGDFYVAIQSSGTLDELLRRGVEYAFISNSDNLGAVLDLPILGYFASSGMPFLMEVADRTDADSKGGHLARRLDGRPMLREVSQCPPERSGMFGDIERYCYFNTNNLWLNLKALREELSRRDGVLPLPMIRNSKTLDALDPLSPQVYQLETAMGAAIEVFEGAGAIRVPRSRFAPVKRCSDLLALWSDAFHLTPDHRVTPNPQNHFGVPKVLLDPRFYTAIQDLALRFPYGAPSLWRCRSLEVDGEFRFGHNVTVIGSVRLLNRTGRPVEIEDNAILDHDVSL
jgi:UTP--glucose-1-phosphate uridylyltransferase